MLGSCPTWTRAPEDSPIGASGSLTDADSPPGVGAAVSTTTLGTGAAVFVADAGAGATISVAAAGACATVSTTTVVTTAVAGVSTIGASGVGTSPAGSSSSSRTITSVCGGTPRAASYPTGSAMGAEDEAWAGACATPNCGTPSSATTLEAASTQGTTASPTTPPLAPGGVTAGPAEVADDRSAFFGASSGLKPHGAALQNNDDFIKRKNQLDTRKE